MTSSLRGWKLAAAWAGVVLAATSVPLPAGAMEAGGLPVDKAGHFLLYAGFGAIVLGAAGWTSTGRRRLLTLAAVAVSLLLFAALDEAHQAWIPAREPSVADWVADAAGITVGMGAYALGLLPERLRRRLEATEPESG